MAANDNAGKDAKTAPVAGPARVGAAPAGIEATGRSPGATGPGIVGSSLGPIGGTNAAAAIPSDASGIAQGMTGPAGAPKTVSQLGLDENPDHLGHEGMQSTVKRNTTDGGKFQDRD